MSEPIVVIDRSAVRAGRIEELRAAVEKLAAFVEMNEPRPVAYDIYLDPACTTMTVVQVHPDSASMETHMRVAASEFAGFAELLELRSMEIFGTPSQTLVEQLRRKVELLGSATLAIHERAAGFVRGGDTSG